MGEDIHPGPQGRGYLASHSMRPAPMSNIVRKMIPWLVHLTLYYL